MPKSVALQFPTQTALYTVFPMQWSLWVYGGFIRFLNGGGWLLLKVMGVRQTGHRHIHSPEELELLIAESRDGGLLEPDEHRRLQRALRMRLRTAGHLMVPRGRIHAADIDTPFDELLPRLAASPYTRVPVYDGTLDRPRRRRQHQAARAAPAHRPHAAAPRRVDAGRPSPCRNR